MIRWIPYTFVRTVLFFIGGILVGYYSPDVIPLWLAVTFIAALTFLYFVIVFSPRRVRRVFNPGWVALPLMFFIGYCHLIWKTESRYDDHLLNNKENIFYYRAVVTRFPEEKARSWKIEARINDIQTEKWKPSKAKIVLYFSKSDFPDPFRYGDVLLIKGRPQRPEGPGNPGEFDYREYLALKNIYHQHFIRAGGVVKLGHAPPNIFTDMALRTREWAGATLNRFVSGEREQAIASALVLGVTDGLDDELLSAYSATGSMHILAVSGLHISIIYFILLWMLSPLNKVKGGRWIVAFISLTILWLYAFVTGLSPSVLRAVAMFSFLAVARPWAKSTNVYNTLAVSAFCLLLADPFLVFSVGFQLSYLAVLGIVYIYPRLVRLWEPPHWITVEIWKLAAVSISAQIATFPLGLLYFHQFPNYFLISNLLVVPLSFVVLIVGLVVLAVSFIPLVASGLGFCLQWVIRFLNGIVFTLDDFPFSITDNVFISPLQCVLLLVVIFLVLALFESRRFKYVVFAFMGIVVFAGIQWIHFFRDVNIRQLAVYKIPGHTAIDLIDRGATCFLADRELQTDVKKLRYHVTPNRLMAGATTVLSQPRSYSFKGGTLIVWNGLKILRLTDGGFELPESLAVDWIIIGNNAVPDITRITEGITCSKVILDSSNSFFFASHFLEAAKLYKLDVHSVLHQGAFTSKPEKQDT